MEISFITIVVLLALGIIGFLFVQKLTRKPKSRAVLP